MIFNYKLYGLYLTMAHELSLDNLLKWISDNVLAVVIAICFLIWLFVTKKKPTASNRGSNAVIVPPNDTITNDTTDYINDSELVAIITAAIMAAMGDEAPPDGFSVRSIKKVNRRKHNNNYSF